MRTILLLITLLPAIACGGPIYKCLSPSGTVSYQGQPCAADAHAEVVHIRHRDPEPVAEPEPSRPDPAPTVVVQQAPERPASWRCRSEGETWYQHHECPATITVREQLYIHGRLGHFIDVPRPVTSQRITRREACREIERAGAVTRKGRERDERAGSYERARGGGPC